MPQSPWTLLGPSAKALLGLEVPEAQIAGLRQFVALLETWSSRINLVSAASVEELVFRHVLDSLAPMTFLRRGDSLGDVGSGAGFPGIPLLILGARPVWLIEARQRRASFLRHVLRSLELEGGNVFEGRAEDFPEALDTLVARAVQPELLFAIGQRLLRPGGRLVLMEKQGQERGQPKGWVERDRFDYELPGGLLHRIRALERCFT